MKQLGTIEKYSVAGGTYLLGSLKLVFFFLGPSLCAPKAAAKEIFLRLVFGRRLLHEQQIGYACIRGRQHLRPCTEGFRQSELSTEYLKTTEKVPSVLPSV